MKHADIIKRLIREVLSTPPKKDKCNCGCNTCKNVGNPGPVLNENLTAKIIMSENMKYHVDNKVALTENTFRYGSDVFLDLWAEARYLFSRNAIHVNDLDKEILLETNLGEYGIYNGIKVALDLPMLEEDELGGPEDINIKNINYLSIKANEIPLRNIIKRAQEKNLYGTPFYNELISQMNQKSIDMDEVKNILRDYGYYYEFDDLLNLNENELGGPEDIEDIEGTVMDPATPIILQLKNLAKKGNKRAEKIYDELINTFTPEEKQQILNKYFPERLNEAKKKKNPPIGKPKRGGSKKFYVYVRNPKTKKIKKVSFGDTTGLSAKINNPEARRAFAARHKCAQKTDKTKASYWSCRIGRYWKSLGGSKNFSGYW